MKIIYVHLFYFLVIFSTILYFKISHQKIGSSKVINEKPKTNEELSPNSTSSISSQKKFSAIIPFLLKEDCHSKESTQAVVDPSKFLKSLPESTPFDSNLITKRTQRDTSNYKEIQLVTEDEDSQTYKLVDLQTGHSIEKKTSKDGYISEVWIDIDGTKVIREKSTSFSHEQVTDSNGNSFEISHYMDGSTTLSKYSVSKGTTEGYHYNAKGQFAGINIFLILLLIKLV